MSVQLIYHTPESSAGGISPFDRALTEMVEGEAIRIACPYLGLDYLHRLIGLASGWRLLTDVEEWLSSLRPRSRNAAVEFILSNRAHIRHCKGLHAKVLVAGEQALIGSANFTAKGIRARVEMSARLADCEEVGELRAWFDLLWEQTAPVEGADLRLCVAAMSPRLPRSRAVSLPSAFPGVAAGLLPLHPTGDDPAVEERLIERFKLAPDRAWIESYLDLTRELLEVTGLTDGDPRLVMSIPPTRKCLPITINRRYVLSAFRRKASKHKKMRSNPNYLPPQGRSIVELILPASMKDRIDRLPDVIRHGWFEPGFSGEMEGNVPRFVSFSVPSRFDLAPEVIEGWHQAVLAERDHARSSNFRQHHEPTLYKAVVGPAYRRRLLDRAFPGSL